MRNVWAVCAREFVSFFITPIGYVVLGTFALISGLGFTFQFFFYVLMSQSPSSYAYSAVPDFEEIFLSPFLVFCGMVIMFMGPMITMRLLAEEKHRGTMELLLTQPLRDRDIIFGKYAASLGMMMLLMAIVGVYMCFVNYFTDVEPLVLAFGLLTVFLMGAAFFSMGLFVSSLCRNQVTAGTITFGVFFIFYILGSLGEDLPEENPAPESWPERLRLLIGLSYRLFRSLIQELAMDAHAREMAGGVLQPYDIAYYVLFAAFFLFLTFRSLDSPKWRS